MATPQEISGLRVNFKDIAPSTPTLMKFDMAAPTANVAGSVAHSFQGYTPADFSGIGKGISKAISDYKDESEAVYLTEAEMQAFMKANPDLASKFTPVNTTDEQGNQITKFRLDSTSNKAPDPYAYLKSQKIAADIDKVESANNTQRQSQAATLEAQASAIEKLNPEQAANRMRELGVTSPDQLRQQAAQLRGSADNTVSTSQNTNNPTPQANTPRKREYFEYEGKQWVADPNGKKTIQFEDDAGNIVSQTVAPAPNVIRKK